MATMAMTCAGGMVAIVLTIIIATLVLLKMQDSSKNKLSYNKNHTGAKRIYLSLHEGGFVCPLNLGDGKRAILFLLDTGFAGVPILNRNHSSTAPPTGCTLADDTFAFSLASLGRVQGHVAEQMTCAMQLDNIVDDDQYHQRFLLMDLDESIPHILTIDFLLSWGGSTTLELGGGSPRVTMGLQSHPMGIEVKTRKINGAYAIRLSILDIDGDILGDGWFIIDTGSPAPLTIGKSFGETLNIRGRHQSQKERFIKQIGVNRESICSLVSPQVIAQVSESSLHMSTPLLINDGDTHGSDGYIGLGMLTRWRSVTFHRAMDRDISVHIDAPGDVGDILQADTRLIDDAMRESC